MGRTFQRRLGVFWFAIACAGLSWVGVASYRGTHGLVRSFDSVSRSHQALEKLMNLQVLIGGAESAVCNFVITGSVPRLEPFWEAKKQVPSRLRELSGLLDGAQQAKALKHLGRLLATHLSFLSNVVTVRENQGFEAAAKWIDAEDDSSREAMTNLLAEVERLAGAQMKRRAHSTSEHKVQNDAVLGLAGLVSLVFLFLGFWLLRREHAVRRQAEDATERMETFLHRIIDRIPYMITVKEAGGLRLSLVNKAAAEWLGKEEKDLLGSNALDLRPREEASREMVSDNEVLRDGKPVDIPEEVWAVAGQEDRIVHTQKVVIQDEQGDPAFLVTISEDITQRKQAERMLELSRDAAVESATIKAEFLRNMSHEFRTPLSLVIGMISLILDSELTADQRRFGESVKRAADGLATLTRDILDFSKIETGSFVLETEEFNVRQTVEGVVRMVSEQAKAKGIGLACLIYSDLPQKVTGDAVRLRQVLTQLVGNAVKFTAKGEVIVRVTEARQEDGNLWLTYKVTDTGIGISEEAQKYVFDPFRQGDGSRTRRFGGTGLGLAMAKRIVELMGGEIGFESRPNEGASFWCTIPFKKHAHGPAIDMPMPMGARARVLIVDESETVRQMLRQQLGSWALASEGISTGEAALALLRSERQAGRSFPIVLIDLHLPDMDGVAFARALRQDQDLAGTQLIVMTTGESPLDPTAAASFGFSASLVKPPTPEALRDCLSRLIEAPAPKHRQQHAA